MLMVTDEVENNGPWTIKKVILDEGPSGGARRHGWTVSRIGMREMFFNQLRIGVLACVILAGMLQRPYFLTVGLSAPVHSTTKPLQIRLTIAPCPRQPLIHKAAFHNISTQDQSTTTAIVG